MNRLRELLAEWRDRRDWRARRGRFAGLDRDAPGRRQIRPVPEPPVERQTHRPGHAERGDA
jgi:hypothetical protein